MTALQKNVQEEGLEADKLARDLGPALAQSLKHNYRSLEAAWWVAQREEIVKAEHGSAWAPYPDIYCYSYSQAFISPIDPLQLAEDDRRLVQTLSKADLFVGLFQDQNVKNGEKYAAIPVLVNARRSNALPRNHGDDHHVVGILHYGEVFPSAMKESLLDSAIRERNNTQRRFQARQRYPWFSQCEREMLDRQCHELHLKSLLIGLLSNFSIPQTNFRIACELGMIELNGVRLAVRYQDEETIEVVFPPFGRYRNTRTYGRPWLERGYNILEAIACLREQLRDRFGDRVRLHLDNFEIWHQYESRGWQAPILSIPRRWEKEVLSLAWDSLGRFLKDPTTLQIPW